MKIKRITAEFDMCPGDINLRMIGYTVRVIYFQLQVNIFHWFWKIRVLEKAILNTQVYIIGRYFIIAVGTSYKTIKQGFTTGFDFGKILLVNSRYQGKNIFEFRGR